MTYLIDADVLVLDYKYQRDPKYQLNRQVLNRLRLNGHETGITLHGLLEAVGILSYMTSVSRIAALPNYLVGLYTLKVYPAPEAFPNYAEITIDEVVAQLVMQMSLGDAVQAVQIRKFASHADGLLTWNAKHYHGKLAIAVLTPDEWLQQQPPTP